MRRIHTVCAVLRACRTFLSYTVGKAVHTLVLSVLSASIMEYSRKRNLKKSGLSAENEICTLHCMHPDRIWTVLVVWLVFVSAMSNRYPVLHTKQIKRKHPICDLWKIPWDVFQLQILRSSHNTMLRYTNTFSLAPCYGRYGKRWYAHAARCVWSAHLLFLPTKLSTKTESWHPAQHAACVKVSHDNGGFCWIAASWNCSGAMLRLLRYCSSEALDFVSWFSWICLSSKVCTKSVRDRCEEDFALEANCWG